MALGLYTALPGFARWDDEYRGLLAAMLPVVGLVLGLLWWGIASLATWLMPPLLAAVVIALCMPVLTGFLHLDGYMDVADAMLSRRPQEDKLRILKDPHTGAFAVIALVCLLLVMVASAESLVHSRRTLAILVFFSVVSRAMAGAAIMSLAPLSQSSYGRMNYETASKPKRLFCLVCLLVAVLVAFVVSWRAGFACVVAAAGFVLVCFQSVHGLGGMNGDISGCSICCAEALGLVALTILS